MSFIAGLQPGSTRSGLGTHGWVGTRVGTTTELVVPTKRFPFFVVEEIHVTPENWPKVLKTRLLSSFCPLLSVPFQGPREAAQWNRGKHRAQI